MMTKGLSKNKRLQNSLVQNTLVTAQQTVAALRYDEQFFSQRNSKNFIDLAD